MDLFPSETPAFDALMATLGYSPADTTTTNTATASGVGNVACKAVLTFATPMAPTSLAI